MCFSTSKAQRQATAQAAADADAARKKSDEYRTAMMAEQQATRDVLGKTAPPPAPYRLKNKPGTGGVKTRKPNKRSSGIGIAALRNPLNTGGPKGGGINVG